MILRAVLTVNEPLTCVMNSVCYKTHLCLHIPPELWLCWGRLPSALWWPEPSQAYKPLPPASPPSSCLLRAGVSTCPQGGQPAGSMPWVQSSELMGRVQSSELMGLSLGSVLWAPCHRPSPVSCSWSPRHDGASHSREPLFYSLHLSISWQALFGEFRKPRDDSQKHTAAVFQGDFLLVGLLFS